MKLSGYINPLVVNEILYGYLRLITRFSARRIRELLAKRDRGSHRLSQK